MYGGASYRIVNLPSGCTFTNEPSWRAVGEYGPANGACAALAQGTSSQLPTGGSIGLYQKDGTKAFFRTTNGGQTLMYFYLQFVCCTDP